MYARRAEFKVLFDVNDYVQYAFSQGSEAVSVAYIEGADKDGNLCWGVGTDPSTITSSLRAVLGSIERLQELTSDRSKHSPKAVTSSASANGRSKTANNPRAYSSRKHNSFRSILANDSASKSTPKIVVILVR